MTPPAIADTNWLQASELYRTVGNAVEIDWPIYQGDVFSDVPVPELPVEMPVSDRLELPLRSGMIMIVPHPCRCYRGDMLRERLTIAPVDLTDSYGKFGKDHSGWTDHFGLPGLVGDTADGGYVADFSRLVSLPTSWLDPEKRIACLSHKGLGLLAKRMLGFQLRYPVELGAAMVYTAGEWTEAFLMQAWVRTHRTLAGYSAWLKTPVVIAGVNGGEPIAPRELRESGRDVLLGEITGHPIAESE